MEEIMSVVNEGIVSLVVVVLGAVFAWVGAEVKKFVNEKRKSDKLGIIDMVTDYASEIIEERFKGEAGEKKFNEALAFASKQLSEMGVKGVGEETLRAGVQDGYNKLKERGFTESSSFKDIFVSSEGVTNEMNSFLEGKVSDLEERVEGMTGQDLSHDHSDADTEADEKLQVEADSEELEYSDGLDSDTK